MNLEQIGENCLERIKRAGWFPYKTGNLKYHATMGSMIAEDTYCITFDGQVAPYIPYLEEGTKPHDIPRAFGRELPFGIRGRFDGKFHPGSVKNRGFIKDKSVNTIINYIKSKYNGELR